MSVLIIGQVRFVLVTLCLGMSLMLGYDTLRFFRWLIPHHKFCIALEDILYWGLAAIPAYALFFYFNDGEIRWYGALAVFLGGILYENGISRIVRRFGRRYLEKPKRKLMGMLGKYIRSMHIKKMYKKSDEKLYNLPLKKGKNQLQNEGK